jgi:hypothetical protein
VNQKASKAARYTTDLDKVCHQKARFADMEARLMVLTQDFTDHNMGYREEEAAIHRSSKKISINNGTVQPSSTAMSSHVYAPPSRINRSSNKRTQLSSPAAHYTTGGRQSPSLDEDSTALTQFFEPSGRAQQALAEEESISNHLSSPKRDSINYSKMHKGVDYSAINDFGTKGDEEQVDHQNSLLATSLAHQWLITS